MDIIIPPSPNWFESKILACAPDNTIIYGGQNDLVIISPERSNTSCVQIISSAHQKKVNSVAVCLNWGPNQKLAVSTGEDNIVRLWDIETGSLKFSHKAHIKCPKKIVGAVFCGTEDITSVTENGTLVVWKWYTNELRVIKDLLGSRADVVCISSCPHIAWMIAVGFWNGRIAIVDVRKTGKIIHNLKGHNTSITSLSWCPTPYNVFPKTRDKAKPIEIGKNGVDLKMCEKEQTENHQTPQHCELSIEQQNVEYTEVEEVVCEVIKNEKTEQAENDQSPQHCELNIVQKNMEHTDEQKVVYEVSENKKNEQTENDQIPQHYEINIEQQNVENTDEQKVVYEVSENEKTEQRVSEQIPQNCELNIKQKVNHSEEEKVVCAINETEKTEDNKGNENEKSEQTENDQIPQHCELNIVQQSVQHNEEDKLVSVVSENEKTDQIENNQIINIEQQNVEHTKEEIVVCEVNENEKTEDNKSDECQELKVDGRNAQKVDSFDEKNENACEENPQQQTITEEKRLPMDYLLASSARTSQKIIIWRAGSDGIKQTDLGQFKGRDKCWTSTCWVSPYVLLSSSGRGDLCKWDFSKQPLNKNNYQSTIVHKDHDGSIFTIAAPFVMYHSPQMEWEIENAWTVGKDRLIINTSLKSDRKVLGLYSTCAGSVHCMTWSILDPNRLALGFGNNRVYIWDFSRPNENYIYLSPVNHKMNDKIQSLAWHPSKETWLAFGTADGKVGYIDHGNSSKTPTLFVQHFTTPIHKVDWGPLSNDNSFGGLFCCTNGELMVYNVNKPTKDPTILHLCKDQYVTQFSWKPDYKILATGTKSGNVSLFTPDLKRLSTLYVQTKSVQCIAWHHQATAEDSSGESPYKDWVAIATNGHEVLVYNCPSNADSYTLDDVSDNVVAVLEGHVKGKCVKSLAWSPHENGKLVSVGIDGLALVWDVKSKILLGAFVQPYGDAISKVIWSPVDADHVVTAAKDGTVRVWSVSKNPPENKDLKPKRREHDKKYSELSTEETPSVESGSTRNKVKKNATKSKILTIISKQQSEFSLTLFEDCKRLLSNYDISAKKYESKPDSENKLDLFFGNRENMMNLVESEQNVHRNTGNINFHHHLCLWKGDIGSAVKEAITRKNVTPWIVNLAFTVSPTLGQEACVTYAKQLTETGNSDPLEIVSYYLLCHKIEDAVNVLLNASMYQEAVVLAKCRLPVSDPIIKEILEKWAFSGVCKGNYVVAAQCFIVLGKLEEAARILLKSSDMASLNLALELAQMCHDKDLIGSATYRLNTLKEGQSNNNDLPTRSECFLNNNETVDKTDLKDECVLDQKNGSYNKEENVKCNGNNSHTENVDEGN